MAISTEVLNPKQNGTADVVNADASNVPLGYKQTKVGVIPLDWNCYPLSAVAASQRNAIVGGPFGSDLVSKDYVELGVPVIRGQNMNGRWIQGPYVFVTDLKARSLSANLAHPGDIVFTQRGTLGQVSLVPEQPYDAYLVSQSQMKVTLNRNLIDPIFLFHVFSSSYHQRVISDRTIQTGVPHINLGILRDIPIQVPSLPEQRAIAEALSDVDELLGALEALIAKKRAIKQGVMQQLLTGKTRLPGFSGEWKTSTIGDQLVYERPDQYIVRSAEYTERGDVAVLTANKSFILGYTDETLGVYRAIPVIIFDDFTTDCKFATFPFKVKSSAIKLLRPRNDRVNLRYMFERMQLIRFPISDHKRHYIAEYRHIELSLPKYEEQESIVSVLSDMDAEIAALEARRDKTRAIKQGMMQQLLTGRIRLVKPQPAETEA